MLLVKYLFYLDLCGTLIIAVFVYSRGKVRWTVPVENSLDLTHLSLASLLWDIGKQYSPRCDAADRGVPSGAILFAQRNFIEK